MLFLAACASDGADHCVPAAAKVGDLVQLPNGRVGKVTELAGGSIRCSPDLPIRARLELQENAAKVYEQK